MERSLLESARIATDSFEVRERADGTRYTTLHDDAPVFVGNVVHMAHGHMLPDDWTYQAVASACDWIAGTLGDGVGSDDLDDAQHEWSDGYVDTYTGDLLTWLASHSCRPGYCDEAVADGLVGVDASLMERVRAGQYAECQELFASVLWSLRDASA